MWRLGAMAIVASACGRVSFDAVATADATGSNADDGPSADASCLVATATGRVAAYTFADTAMLGRDAVGPNHMTLTFGNPQQSSDVPPGFLGHSLALDGSSGMCIPFTTT